MGERTAPRDSTSPTEPAACPASIRRREEAKRSAKIHAVLDAIKALEGEPIPYSTGLLVAKVARELRMELENVDD